MVASLLEFKLKFDGIISGPFCHDPDLAHAVKDGFEIFVNKRQNKPAEMIGPFAIQLDVMFC